MSQVPLYGSRIRALRRREGITQADFAKRLGVSPSYINLIENNRRPLSANLLLRLAKEFKLDLSEFSTGDDRRLTADLLEAFGDPLLADRSITKPEVIELASSMPDIARAILVLYRGYRASRDSADSLAEHLTDGLGSRLQTANPSEEVNDFIQSHRNYFESLEDAAESLWKRANLRTGEIYPRLIDFLAREHNIETRLLRAKSSGAMRRFDRQRGVLELSEVMPPRTRRFQLAHQVALITQSELFNSLAAAAPELNSEDARGLARVILANYFSAAVLMPYRAFHKAANEVRYDLELLAHRYQTSFEQVCHRLTSLRRPGLEGIPLHFVRIDIAGNITKRFSASGFRLPRFSGACPRWNVHDAFMTPGIFRMQLARMPDGSVYFCLARTVQRASGGYKQPHVVHSIGIGCEVSHAREMVYSDGVDLGNLEGATPVGVTCRTCDQSECEQRVFPPLSQQMRFDENVRGRAFYAGHLIGDD